MGADFSGQHAPIRAIGQGARTAPVNGMDETSWLMHGDRRAVRHAKALFASSGVHPLEPPSTLAAGHPAPRILLRVPRCAVAPPALRGFGWCWSAGQHWERLADRCRTAS